MDSHGRKLSARCGLASEHSKLADLTDNTFPRYEEFKNARAGKTHHAMIRISARIPTPTTLRLGLPSFFSKQRFMIRCISTIFFHVSASVACHNPYQMFPTRG